MSLLRRLFSLISHYPSIIFGNIVRVAPVRKIIALTSKDVASLDHLTCAFVPIKRLCLPKRPRLFIDVNPYFISQNDIVTLADFRRFRMPLKGLQRHVRVLTVRHSPILVSAAIRTVLDKEGVDILKRKIAPNGLRVLEVEKVIGSYGRGLGIHKNANK